jgi:hypothetical protein
MEQISRTDRLKYDEVLNSVKEEMNILHTMKSFLDWSDLAQEMPSKIPTKGKM